MSTSRQDDDGWEKIRCPNRSCKSFRSGGAVLFERRGSLHRKGPKGGQMTGMGMPINAQCESCGHHWLNPEMVAFDGIGQVFQRTITEVAGRVREQLIEERPIIENRRRLRGAVAA